MDLLGDDFVEKHREKKKKVGEKAVKGGASTEKNKDNIQLPEIDAKTLRKTGIILKGFR